MLDDYREAFRQCADLIEGWQDLSKNELCRKYVENEGNPYLQNAYFSAIMYRYWNLIPKYYYMSNNVASEEDCYEWLEDSVVYCLKERSWEKKSKSIYEDPNGPDKAINRCMKCARLTYYQFINRQKRKDNFGLLSLDELAEAFGNTVSEPESAERLDEEITNWAIHEYIHTAFDKKDYFVAVMLDMIQQHDVFENTSSTDGRSSTKFSLRKLTKIMSDIKDDYILDFSSRYSLPKEKVEQGINYFRHLKSQTIRAKLQVTLERLQHDEFFKLLNGGT